jgi:hypothetical protein
VKPAEVANPTLFDSVLRFGDDAPPYFTAITLADVFAAHAMAALIQTSPGTSFVTIAAHAWAASDAMLWRRAERLRSPFVASDAAEPEVEP